MRVAIPAIVANRQPKGCRPDAGNSAAMPSLKLQLISTGRPLELHDPIVQLGRDPSAAVSFSGDDARVVSTRHAELRHTGDAWRLVDLGSRNGSYVNGQRVQGESPVKKGDEIRLGETGPRILVVATDDAIEATVTELPKFDVAPTAGNCPGEATIPTIRTMANLGDLALGLPTMNLILLPTRRSWRSAMGKSIIASSGARRSAIRPETTLNRLSWKPARPERSVTAASSGTDTPRPEGKMAA